jgi:hypothetical protein
MSSYKAQCVLCGYTDSEHDGAGLVQHINEEHAGGLPKYLLFFGSIPLLGYRLQTACEDCVHTGYRDPSVPELKMISESDMRLIVETAERNKPERSEISVTAEDF